MDAFSSLTATVNALKNDDWLSVPAFWRSELMQARVRVPRAAEVLRPLLLKSLRVIQCRQKRLSRALALQRTRSVQVVAVAGMVIIFRPSISFPILAALGSIGLLAYTCREKFYRSDDGWEKQLRSTITCCHLPSYGRESANFLKECELTLKKEEISAAHRKSVGVMIELMIAVNLGAHLWEQVGELSL